LKSRNHAKNPPDILKDLIINDFSRLSQSDINCTKKNICQNLAFGDII